MQASMGGLLLCTLLTVAEGLQGVSGMGDGMVNSIEMSPVLELYNTPLRNLLQQEDDMDNQALALAKAARTGRDDEVQALLNANVDPNLLTSGGTPALWRAAFNNHSSTAQILLDAGAKIDARNANGTTALYAAAQNGHQEIVALLIANGANVNVLSKWGSSPVLVASQEGFAKVTEVLLDAGAILNVSKTESGQGALWSAAFGGHKEVVRILLKNGATVDVPDANGRTPLIAASQNGHSEIVQILLNADADPNKEGTDGNTALHIASFYCHSLVTALLVKHGGKRLVVNSSGYIPLYLACWKEKMNAQNYGQQQYQKVVDALAPLFKATRLGNVPDIEKMIDSGEDINQKLWDGWTLLHEAARSRQPGVTTMLLDRGMNVNAADNLQQSALHVAAQTGSNLVLSVLFQNGADASHKDAKGRTPLHTAALYDQGSVTDVLLKNGINGNVLDKTKQSAVHLAASKGHANFIQTLVFSTIDPDVGDKFGNTALHYSAAEGDLTVLIAVMLLSPDLDAQNLDGETPLHTATKAKNVDIVQELLKNGSDQTILNKDGKPPRDIVGSTKRSISTAEEMITGLLLENAVSGLLQATREGDATGVQRWLAFGVDVDYALSNGTTALHVATQNGDVDMLNIILNSGANASIPDKRGWTILHYAAHFGRNEILRAVAGEDLAVLAKDQDGRTALHLAPASDLANVETIVLLLDIGGDVNARDHTGRSPLHVAASNARLKMVRILVEAGCDIKLLDDKKNQPIDLLPSNIDEEKHLKLTGLLRDSSKSKKGKNVKPQVNSTEDALEARFQSTGGNSGTTAKSGMPMVMIAFMILLPSVFVFLLAGLSLYIYKRSKARGMPSCWDKEGSVETPSTLWTDLYNPSEMSVTSSSLPLRARQALAFSKASSNDAVSSPVLFPNPYFGATGGSSGSVRNSFLEDAIDAVQSKQSGSAVSTGRGEVINTASSADETQSSMSLVEMPQRSCISLTEQGAAAPAQSPVGTRLKSRSAQSFQTHPRTVPLPLHNMRVEIQRKRRQERYPTLYTDARSHFSSYSSRSQISDNPYYSATSNFSSSRHTSQESFGSSALGIQGWGGGRIPEEQPVEQFETLRSLYLPSSSHSAFVRDVQSEP